MIRVLPLFLLLAACAHAHRAPKEPDPATVRREASRAFLAEAYGCDPREGTRSRRDLEDLLDREDRVVPLRRPDARAFVADLHELTGYRFRPKDAVAVAAAPSGPPGQALADDRVRGLLAELRREGRLAPGAGRSLIRLTESQAGALRRLSADPDAPERIERLAVDYDYRFLASDAKGLVADWPFTAEEARWLGDLLSSLRAGFRPTWRKELAVLVSHRDAVDELISLSRDGGVGLGGPGTVLVLSRLAPDYRSFDETERERFLDLAGRARWPDARDLLYLVRLARVPGIGEVATVLRKRWQYRFDPADGPALIHLVEAGVPDPALPDWLVRDRVRLRYPGDLVSEEPAGAFADPNDLRFMEALEASRPELAARSRDYLERTIRRWLARIPRQLRAGAPYDEFEGDLGRFLRPDLLKAILMLEELERPEVRAEILAWLKQDMEDRTTELGGYVRLTPEGRLRLELSGVVAGRDDRVRLAPDPAGCALDFHFHATDEDESAFAGPSSGGPGTDLFRAAHHRVDGLVFTKMTDDRFNTDLYLSTKYVLDLGVRGP